MCPELSAIFEDCVADYIKYEGSTAVLAALARIVVENPSLGTVYGITKDVSTGSGTITPDVTIKSADSAGALLFELKWTLTRSTAPSEILDLKRYLDAEIRWNPGSRATVNVVLVVNEEDASIAIGAVNNLVSSGNTFLSTGLAIWKWHYSTGRDIGGETSIWFEKIWGQSGTELEQVVQSGYRTLPEVLRYIRWTYRFTKDKPPVQYTIGTLLMHVFSSFRTTTHAKETIDVDASMTDTVYERTKSFFPNKDPSNETVQARKQWIREALSSMRDLGMAEIRVPTQTRDSLQVFLCRKVQTLVKRLEKKRTRSRSPRVGRVRIRRPKPSPKDTKLI